MYSFAKVSVERLITQYKLGRTTIKKVLQYDAPKRSRITRTRRPSLLIDIQVDEIIEYLSELWEHRILDFTILYNELELKCSIIILEY